MFISMDIYDLHFYIVKSLPGQAWKGFLMNRYFVSLIVMNLG